ncbi:MAG: hypothetical protein ACK5NE_00935 [Brachymonas sp.]
MTQTLIVFLLVACAAAYSFWRLMPGAWRRKLRRAAAPLAGNSPAPHGDKPTSSCGSCSGCNGCG